MRLKHLELYGYKTFASRTSFVFDGGITAIVGPNGSGKSNIADALRWVLGEQSYRSLRGKRTEDMIFSGSTQRARLGMASASLVLDNETGWLPIDFSEVTISRRAYRSGENEYMLNGQRVRLTDITELLSKSGLAQRTYTVVGQGVVDSVLSLRPEDRRALFEEAAGIAVYRSKRSDALVRLEETRANLLRVGDIVNEIAPRLRRLEREVERAEVHRLLSQQLEGMLHTWYGYRWHQIQLDLRRARDAVARREGHLARRREALQDLDERTATVRAQQSQVREQLGGWHRESSELHRQMEQVQRDLAVWQERARLLAKQSDELETELADLQVHGQAAAERLQGGEVEVAASDAVRMEREALMKAAEHEIEILEGQRGQLSRQMAKAQARAVDLAAEAAERSSRLTQLGQRRVLLAKERQDHQVAMQALQGHLAQVSLKTQANGEERNHQHKLGEGLAAEVTRLDAALNGNRSRQAELRASLNDAQLPLGRMQARFDALAHLREEGEGLHAGVRAVLQAASPVDGTPLRLSATSQPSGLSQPHWQDSSVPVRDRTGLPPQPSHLARLPRAIQAQDGPSIAASSHGREAGRSSQSPPRKESHNKGRTLAGIVGTIAELVEVPAEYETAIEVALGGHLQDIVVESWAHAEEAISFLRTGNCGRATFLPLDTVRPLPLLEMPQTPGVIGLGVDLVLAQDRLARVLDMLLGRTLIVEDLKAARAAFDRLHGGFQIVTLGGDVLRSSGSVTGGQGKGQEQGRVLAREREWRELPAQLKEAEERLQQINAALGRVAIEEQHLREQHAAVVAQQKEHQRTVTRMQAQGQDLERECDRFAQQIAWRQGLVAQLDAEETTLDAVENAMQAEVEDVASDRQAAESRVAALQAELDQLRGASLYQRLSDARTAAAVALGNWEHRRAALESLRNRQDGIQSQIEAKSQRIASLRREQSALAEQIHHQASREAVIRGWLGALAQRIDPAEAEVARLEVERERFATEEATLRARLREAEANHSQAVLARSRQEDRRQRLRRQIMDDFGLVEMEAMEDVPDQLPLPLAEVVSTLPVVETVPEGLEDEIHQLKAQIKRIGSIHPHALEEYAEVLERHTFLTTQAADLHEATRRLRDVIAELDEVMRQEFQRTFDAVGQRFEENFSRLFSGGMARLSLTEPDDLATTGVEIVARPPGKRLQTLALLSGGERSLTAVALIFAFLQTNPPPFCILDEVDAMLDEANVQRFRAMLQDLAQHTQFVVITHNRATVQAANTLYGVSMGEDSVSQVVSLRVEGDRVVVPDSEVLERL